MPAVVRTNKDKHVGHASPSPGAFHQTAYTAGSGDVYVNEEKVVRIGDKTSCGDPASAGSGTVYANNIKVHRKGDATAGHDSWVANSANTGSGDVFADGD
tara:strand:+ start:965 stop:1264 length:300 start_codon:yes stop_codon:yes gene_type:complete